MRYYDIFANNEPSDICRCCRVDYLDADRYEYDRNAGLAAIQDARDIGDDLTCDACGCALTSADA